MELSPNARSAMRGCRSTRRDAPAAIKCGGCGRDIALSFSDSVKIGPWTRSLSRLRWRRLLRPQDFDPKMGLTVVIIGIVISAAFYWFKR
jgi:hypothetical protein